MYCLIVIFYRVMFFFFFNDTATTEIYTLSLHDALPILQSPESHAFRITHDYTVRKVGEKYYFNVVRAGSHVTNPESFDLEDRKSTRLNSSHLVISYAVFCLKKKNITIVILSDCPIQRHA